MEYTTDKSIATSSDEMIGEVVEVREPTEEELELAKQKFEEELALNNTQNVNL